MEFDVEGGSVTVRKFLTSLMPSLIEQLKLSNSRKAVLVKITDDVEGMEGSTLNIEVADCILVLIKSPKKATKAALLNAATTLAHEMVHVRQLAKGLLVFLPNGVRIWKGVRYTEKKTHYLDQPWEQDAFAQQEIIVRRALEV